ncbi:aldo/keto reductase [bacterium 210820-DFI.6.37]|nr:aldo/keto reductase [bacterium 210820-DFI.6.37]
MEKKLLGNTGLEVTPVGFGVLTVGNTQLDLPLAEGAEVLRYGLEKGINFLDTAQYYETYPYIREALKGTDFHPVICSKSLDLTYSQMEYAIQEALREMELETIDIFLLHEVRSGSDWDDRAGAWRCLQDAKAAGLVKAIGVSTHHVDVAMRIASVPEADVLFPLINFKSLGIRKGDGPGTKEEMAEAIKANAMAGKGVFAMKAFGGGNLTGSYVEALDYVKNLEGVVSIMIGFGKKEEIDRIVEYAEGRLAEDYVPDISKKKIHIDQGDCEGCGACIQRCPNRAIFRNENGLAQVDHSVCLTCGYCAPVCPVRAIILF